MRKVLGCSRAERVIDGDRPEGMSVLNGQGDLAGRQTPRQPPDQIRGSTGEDYLWTRRRPDRQLVDAVAGAGGHSDTDGTVS